MIDNLFENGSLLPVMIAVVLIITVTLRVWWSRCVRPGQSMNIDYSEVPLPGITPFDGPGVECSCQQHCKLHTKLLESVRVGSNFTTIPRGKIPKTQVGVYSVDSRGVLEQYLGVAVRLDDWLTVPTHVIVKHKTVAMLSNAPEPIAHKFKTDEFEPVEGDLSAMKLAEKEFSKLGLVKAAVAALPGTAIVSVASSSKEPEMSFGTLRNDATVFGYVIFDGSTKGGFSGAPYMIGKQIVGLHQGGGQYNYGISASYILALLRKPEETADWLLKIREKKGPLKFERSKFNPDEALVFIDGRYHLVDYSFVSNDIPISDIREEEKRTKIPEVNVAETFPPAYKDEADIVANIVNAAVEHMNSKNLEVAEHCSAEQAEEYMKMYNDLQDRINEAVLIMQSMQNSVADRYREDQKMVIRMDKNDEGRKVLVQEIETLKKELTEIKQLKTFVNVETSSLKEIPKPVKKAITKKNRVKLDDALLDKITKDDIRIEDVIQALINKGLVAPVQKDAEAPAGNVATMLVNLIEAANAPRASTLTGKGSKS